jgi:lycopene beta-cyclase
MPYCSLRSTDFFSYTHKLLQPYMIAQKITPEAVSLLLGKKEFVCLSTPLKPPSRLCGYQKFLGLELTHVQPHGMQLPLIMHATCPSPKDQSRQKSDDFEFFYVLPLSPHTLLIELTSYSNTPELEDNFEQRILQYATHISSGLWVTQRRESAALPIFFHPPQRINQDYCIPMGAAHGLVHPTTSYSFGTAASQACTIALHLSLPHPAPQGPSLQPHKIEARQRGFYFLNRVLFKSCNKVERFAVFSRFYKLPLPTIVHFYALKFTWKDWVRLFAGRPPLPLSQFFLFVLKDSINLVTNLWRKNQCQQKKSFEPSSSEVASVG